MLLTPCYTVSGGDRIMFKDIYIYIYISMQKSEKYKTLEKDETLILYVVYII